MNVNRTTLRNVPGRRGWLVRSGSEGSRPPFASARAAGPRRCAAARGDRHKDSRLLSAELQRERTAGVPAEQHGRARRHRRRHHGDRAGRVARHRAQRRPERHRQERVRHRDDLASGLHGRVLLPGQGAAPRTRRYRPRAVGHQGQGAQRAALPVVWRQGARARRALCDLGSASGAGAAVGRCGDGLEGACGSDDGRRLSGVSGGRRDPAEQRSGCRTCGSRGGNRPVRSWRPGGCQSRRRARRPRRHDVRFAGAHPPDHPGRRADPRRRRP